MLHRSMSLIGALAVVTLTAAQADAASAVPAAITAAVADASRPDTDKQRDADRKPAESIAFAGVKSGDHVAELMPGGGYFTRILSKVVGDKGVVYALVPPPRPNAPAGAPAPGAAAEAIAADHKNVRVITGPLTQPTVPEPVDVVWTSQNYHDFHNVPNSDIKTFNSMVFSALKPGGTFIVIDHAAAPGSGANDTQALHRIDPETVKAEVTAVGFKLAGESDLLHNASDPHTANVHDAAIRGKTDQFVLKFTKPKK